MALKLSSYDNVINTNYERILDGKMFDLNLKPYNRRRVDEMIAYFEIREDYEKCAILVKFISQNLEFGSFYKK